MKRYALILPLILVAVWWFGMKGPARSGKPVAEPLSKVAEVVPRGSANSDGSEARRVPAQITTELASLADMSRTLNEFTKPNRRIHDLVEYLKRTRQEPKVARDANPYTGEMAIVRTQSPLPGTRYFHAQYFSGGDGKGFVQHMSFEYKPSPTAMQEAIRSVQDSFGISTPKIQRDDYAQWSLSGGYLLWIKKMDADDLRDDPFNAYGPGDVGTVRVAIEAEIHDEADDGH